MTSVRALRMSVEGGTLSPGCYRSGVAPPGALIAARSFEVLLIDRGNDHAIALQNVGTWPAGDAPEISSPDAIASTSDAGVLFVAGRSGFAGPNSQALTSTQVAIQFMDRGTAAQGTITLSSEVKCGGTSCPQPNVSCRTSLAFTGVEVKPSPSWMQPSSPVPNAERLLVLIEPTWNLVTEGCGLPPPTTERTVLVLQRSPTQSLALGCDPSSCAGCCTPAGCVAGNVSSACGLGGTTCSSCTESICSAAGTCQGFAFPANAASVLFNPISITMADAAPVHLEKLANVGDRFEWTTNAQSEAAGVLERTRTSAWFSLAPDHAQSRFNSFLSVESQFTCLDRTQRCPNQPHYRSCRSSAPGLVFSLP